MELVDLFRAGRVKETFCGLLAFALRKGLHEINGKPNYDRRDFEITQCYHNANGVTVYLRDRVDGQRYTAEIKPVSEGRN